MVQRIGCTAAVGAFAAIVVTAIYSYRAPLEFSRYAYIYSANSCGPSFQFTVRDGAVCMHKTLPGQRIASRELKLPLLHLQSSTCSGGVGHYRAEFSCWLPAGLACVYPAIVLRRRRGKARRVSRGLCAKCGYDLRGSPPGACPECGSVGPALSSGSAAERSTETA